MTVWCVRVYDGSYKHNDDGDDDDDEAKGKVVPVL
jgi:hypothetical protein